MKKTTLTAAMALTLTALMTTGCTASAMNAGADGASGVAPAGSPYSNVSAGIAGSAGSDQYIAQADAENAALADAGLTADAVKGLRGRLEYDDGRAIYDVEFWTETDEYDYDIDATTGEILSMDRDAEDYDPQTASSQQAASGSQPTAAPAAEGDGYIGGDAARQAALDHAGLAGDSSVQFVHTELDRDDGRAIYEVEFWSGSTEYDYEIDAVTGEVLKFDHDAEHHQATPAAGASITADDASRIAFEHAGVAEADVQQLKLQLDEDDGRLEYELEWRIGSTEYECTVDASSGEVLSFETDH